MNGPPTQAQQTISYLIQVQEDGPKKTGSLKIRATMAE